MMLMLLLVIHLTIDTGIAFPLAVNGNGPHYDFGCARSGEVHTECKNTLTNRVRKVKRFSHKTLDVLGCLEDFCCTQKVAIDEKMRSVGRIEVVLAIKERTCRPPPPPHGMQGAGIYSFFG